MDLWLVPVQSDSVIKVDLTRGSVSSSKVDEQLSVNVLQVIDSSDIILNGVLERYNVAWSQVHVQVVRGSVQGHFLLGIGDIDA